MSYKPLFAAGASTPNPPQEVDGDGEPPSGGLFAASAASAATLGYELGNTSFDAFFFFFFFSHVTFL